MTVRPVGDGEVRVAVRVRAFGVTQALQLGSMSPASSSACVTSGSAGPRRQLLDTSDAHDTTAVDDVDAADQARRALRAPASAYTEALVAFARADRVSDAQ